MTAAHVESAAVGEAPSWSRALGRCLGRGGFAAVWEVVDDPALVLKVAHADHDLARARLAREAEALAAIGPPAVPRFDSHGVLADGRPWIAMERIDGTSLGDLVAQGPIRIERVIAMARSLAQALVRFHAGGFIHRDLKPDNIYRRRDGSLVILDLGLARRHPEDPHDPTRAGVQVGSLEYMPPEQLLDAASVDPRADIYAFGCVLYELCAGRPPFVGDASALERAHAALRPPPLGALAQVPSGLEQLCHDCLAKQPARRPASARELATRMDAIHHEVTAVQPQHSRSVISEGKQPVVLLFAELPKVDRALLGMLAARKITVVSQRGRRLLGGVLGVDHADPASAAIAAARDLAGAGARVALHLDALHVTARGGANVLVGPAVERPEDWLPSAPWTGVVLTRALATVTQLPTRPTAAGPGFVMLGEAGDTAQLVGRDAMLSDLVADAMAAFAGAGPALATVIGDHGIGKTALAAALVPRLCELVPAVHTGTIPPPGSGRPAHAALAELVGTPTGPTVRAVGDALRDAARRGPIAIILDDVHLAEHEFLDALEYATLGGEPLPLWILCLAAPRLDQRRPGFGSRAERRRRATLPPLDEDAAVAMTAMLLRPAEYPPLRALRQIAAIARGNPMHLATIAREIHDRGAIRTRPNGEHFLDTTALDALPPVALGPWLAARELAPLGVELVSLARVCAVLGDELDRPELAAVLDAVERHGGATTNIDVDVGLGELEAHGILVPTSWGFAFRQALLHEGIYTTTNEDERRVIHAAALEYWRTRPGDPERIARHAEAVGDRAAAADAFAQLGEEAHREHHLLDADQGWTGALRNLDERSPARTDALLGRARARARQQRLGDALADLEDAIANARALGDHRGELVALLEKATTLDLADDFDASKEVAIVARERFTAMPDPDLAIDLDLAEARNAFRGRRFAEAAHGLTLVADAARACEREDILTTAQLLLAPALVEAGEHAQARTVFADLIERCRQRGDRFHLGAAYGNRAWLWSALGEVDRTADDLRLVIQLAREVGHAMLERVATYNLAEDRFWQGALDEATQLARRSLALQQSHGEGATRFDRLLLARILAVRLERPELTELLAKLATEVSSDEERVVIAALQAVASDADAATWESVLASVDALDPAQRLELSHLAARTGHLAGARRTEILALVQADPIWSRRIDEF